MERNDSALELILEYFEQINAIPRCSKNEARLGRWLADWATARGFATDEDAAGNLVVRVPGTTGMTDRPTVVLQGHMDMVCEKTPDSPHDFTRDPIRSHREGEWLMADRTSLGADNGIALAYALALADDPAVDHPPLELLFTVDEETGLNGVKELPPELIRGRILINLDSEDEGVFTIGCAGGMDTTLTMPLLREPLPEGWDPYEVVVGGLRGGHSGIDIDKQRGNANKMLARTLAHLRRSASLAIATLSGGTRHNAIPRDAKAVIACPPPAQPLMDAAAAVQEIMRNEWKGVDEGLFIALRPLATAPQAVWGPDLTERVLNLLLALPDGVAAMSTTIEGLVETSSNLATMAVEGNNLSILLSQRSAVASRLAALTAKVHAIAALAGATVSDSNKYPPWQPDLTAELLNIARGVYADLFGTQPVLEVIHAGLECAIIGERCPGMQMISFGPDIENPHSPTERMHLPSVEKVWRFLVALLSRIGETESHQATL